MSFDINRIQKSARKVSQFLRKNAKSPSANAVHDLRTSSRSLESTFTTLGLDSKKDVRRLLRDLGKIRKRAGKVRDMDVLTEDALTLKPGDEKHCFVQLLKHLGARRNKYAKKLRREIELETPQLRRSLERNSKRLEKVLKEAKDNPRDSSAAITTKATIVKLYAQLKTPARLTRTNLHPYRLKVKELRNVLQWAEQPGDTKFLEKLGEVKDAIGEWHDWEELVSIASQLLDHGEECRLIRKLKSTSDSKYEHALALTADLRKHHLNLNGEHPQQGSSPAVQPTPDSVTGVSTNA